MKLCNDCIKLFTAAGYDVDPEPAATEHPDKCDNCRKRRWVTSVAVATKKPHGEQTVRQRI